MGVVLGFLINCNLSFKCIFWELVPYYEFNYEFWRANLIK